MDGPAKKSRHRTVPRSGRASPEYLRRVQPEEYVERGGLALLEERPLGIRDRERDLHPPDPEEADVDLAIAALLHKMEILDALIFHAREHGLEITTLIGLYLRACSQLGGLIGDRHALESQENGDLMRLLERANAQLEGES